jgi:integrase
MQRATATAALLTGERRRPDAFGGRGIYDAGRVARRPRGSGARRTATTPATADTCATGGQLHMLRHACGYALADKGHDTRALQAYLGHRNIQHTVRYTELSPTRFKDFWR